MMKYEDGNGPLWAAQNTKNLAYFVMSLGALVWALVLTVDTIPAVEDKALAAQSLANQHQAELHPPCAVHDDYPGRCILFKDDFDELDLSKWQHEIALGENEKQTFHIFENSRYTSKIYNGTLILHPIELNSSDVQDGGVQDLHRLCTSNADEDCNVISDGTTYLSSVRTTRISTCSLPNSGLFKIRAKVAKGAWQMSSIRLRPERPFYGPGIRSGVIDIAQIRGNDPTYYYSQTCTNVTGYDACTTSQMNVFRDAIMAAGWNHSQAQINEFLFGIACHGFNNLFPELFLEFVDLVAANPEPNSAEAFFLANFTRYMALHLGPIPSPSQITTCRTKGLLNGEFDYFIDGVGVNSVQGGIHLGPSQNLDARSLLGGYKTFEDELSDDFHDYSLEWTEDSIIHRVDNFTISSIDLTQSLFNCTYGLLCGGITGHAHIFNCSVLPPLLCGFFSGSGVYMFSNATTVVDLTGQAHAHGEDEPDDLSFSTSSERFVYFLNRSQTSLPTEMNPYYGYGDNAPLDQTSWCMDIELTAGGKEFVDSIGGKPWSNSDSATLANKKFVDSGGIAPVSDFIIDSVLVLSEAA